MHEAFLSDESFDPEELAFHDHRTCDSDPISPSHPRDDSIAIPTCPKCQSTLIEARHRARRTGGAVGTVAGTASGVAFALSSAETGAIVGSLAGPAGALCGAIAGAVIAGLVVGAAGCAAGSAFGEIVDDKVLKNYRCHACSHTFSRTQASV